jgi:hypothetical protein
MERLADTIEWYMKGLKENIKLFYIIILKTNQFQLPDGRNLKTDISQFNSIV